MDKALALGCRGAPCLAVNRNRACFGGLRGASALPPHQQAPVRLCRLRCSASARLARLSSTRGRRRAVVCNAAAKNFYELLGVTQSASDRDIKSAYRKLAMKLHPDVNKAPDAQQRFMAVKVAYETLSDAKQRAEYDRRLRMGGFSSSSSRAGAGYGSSSSSSGYGGSGYGSSGSWGSYGSGPNYTQEPVPGLDDLIRELEKEFTAWANQRSKDAKAKTLMEELEDLGGELLDFLEDALGIKDEPQASASGSSGQRSAGPGDTRDTRSAAERFDYYWRQYGEGTGGAGTGSGSRAAGSGGSYAGAAAGSSTSSASSSSGTPRQAPRKSLDDEVEAELQALKKKLNKS